MIRVYVDFVYIFYFTKSEYIDDIKVLVVKHE